jgi:hypothetical protein
MVCFLDQEGKRVFIRIKSLAIGLALIMPFLVACGTGQPTPLPPEPTCGPEPTPRIIEHPEPTLAADVQIIRTDYKQGDRCIRTEAFLNPKCVRVRVKQDGVSRTLSTPEELRDWFTPIESADEALSYALLATGYEAKYAPEDYRLAVGDPCDPGPAYYHYYTDVLEDTHVVEVAKGYQVNLFDSKRVGCGPFPVSSVTVEVSVDGTISERPMIKLFEQGEPCPGDTMVQCCID